MTQQKQYFIFITFFFGVLRYTILVENEFISKKQIYCVYIDSVHEAHYMACLSAAEEILDDGVGLLLESSGDSLDDDSEIFSEFDECRKVRAQILLVLLMESEY